MSTGHDFDHCSGTYFSSEDTLDTNMYRCTQRDTCKRYLAMLALKMDREHLPKGYPVYFLSAEKCVKNQYQNHIDV